MPKLSNQNAVFIGYNVLIGCFSSINTKIVLQSFMVMVPGKWSSINKCELKTLYPSTNKS